MLFLARHYCRYLETMGLKHFLSLMSINQSVDLFDEVLSLLTDTTTVVTNTSSSSSSSSSSNNNSNSSHTQLPSSADDDNNNSYEKLLADGIEHTHLNVLTATTDIADTATSTRNINNNRNQAETSVTPVIANTTDAHLRRRTDNAVAHNTDDRSHDDDHPLLLLQQSERVRWLRALTNLRDFPMLERFLSTALRQQLTVFLASLPAASASPPLTSTTLTNHNEDDDLVAVIIEKYKL
jgi:hypothetical protein